jgi:cob(I)alamin adenosyltransferase
MQGRIYTRRGDDGTTSLVGGERVRKNSMRVEAYGTVDELNSHVGLARAGVADQTLAKRLAWVQQRLFNCSSNLATPPDAMSETTPGIADTDVERLESWIDEMTDASGDLDHFVIENGSDTAARLHVARAITRRAERAILDLDEIEHVDEGVRKFVNRLSDFLFASARYVNTLDGVDEQAWDAAAEPPA